jgi:hypothetical protein
VQGNGEVLVDTVEARESATRVTENLGWKVRWKEQPDRDYLLVIKNDLS